MEPLRRGGGYFNTDAEDVILTQGSHEPIIEPEIFEAVQDKIAEIEVTHFRYRRETRPGDYMLKGAGTVLVLRGHAGEGRPRLHAVQRLRKRRVPGFP